MPVAHVWFRVVLAVLASCVVLRVLCMCCMLWVFCCVLRWLRMIGGLDEYASGDVAQHAFLLACMV